MESDSLIRELAAGSTAELEAARALFREYAGSLGIELDFQDFDREIAELPDGYTAPTGALLLAWRGSQPLGCVGVRAATPLGACEMKRLYVRPEAQGAGVGRRLAEAAIGAAARLGYERLLLDTLPTMEAAQALYRELGFREIEPYRFNPIVGTRFLELRLAGDAR